MRIPEKISSASKTHVLGVTGQEGRAAFDYLLSADIDVLGHVSVPESGFRDTFLSFSDAYEEKEARDMAEKFISSGKLLFGSDYGSRINAGDAVIVPQAYRKLSLNAPVIEMDRAGEITLIQVIELAFAVTDCKTVGVTGTAGKSTVTALIKSVLESSGKPFCFSGNDRENKWDFFALETLSQNGFALFEISHRHLMDLKTSPNVAVITNIFPHHLDDAGSYDNYVEIKKNILRFQNAGDIAIVNHTLVENGALKENEEINGTLLTFGSDGANAKAQSGFLKASFANHFVEIPLSEFKLLGEHNVHNALAAMLAGLACDLPVPAIEDGIKKFKGLKYREELVGEYNGVIIINDGKSTDPLATIEAVRTVPKIGALILCGIREGFSDGDFIPLGKEIKERDVKNVFIFGSSKDDMARDLSHAGINPQICSGIDEAVLMAKDVTKSGEAIVFSPGCQSFDEFRDYRHRASAFNLAVEKIFGA
ncbi:MAG: Mur ligase family protein [Parcubacteria group bacterium]